MIYLTGDNKIEHKIWQQWKPTIYGRQCRLFKRDTTQHICQRSTKNSKTHKFWWLSDILKLSWERIISTWLNFSQSCPQWLTPCQCHSNLNYNNNSSNNVLLSAALLLSSSPVCCRDDSTCIDDDPFFWAANFICGFAGPALAAGQQHSHFVSVS